MARRSGLRVDGRGDDDRGDEPPSATLRADQGCRCGRLGRWALRMPAVLGPPEWRARDMPGRERRPSRERARAEQRCATTCRRAQVTSHPGVGLTRPGSVTRPPGSRMAPKILENDKSPWSGCSRRPVTRGFVVGVRGFEPPASTSRTTPFRASVSPAVPSRADLAGLLRVSRSAGPVWYHCVPDSLAPKMAPKI